MKTYFSLPYFYTLDIPNKLFELRRTSTFNGFKEKDYTFLTIDFNFPYSFWNGDINSDKGPLLLANDINNLVDGTFLPFRISLSNINLTESNLKDRRLNTILDICHTGSNFITFSDLKTYQYVKEKFPNYHFILSANADLVAPFTPTIIDQFILNLPDLDFVEIPQRVATNMEFLSQIKHKAKIEVPIFPHIPCVDYDSCHLSEQAFQYAFNEKSIITNCQNCCCNYFTPNPNIRIENLSDYTQMGINHFRLVSFPYSQDNLFQFLLYFTHNFITEEKQYEILNYLMKEQLQG